MIHYLANQMVRRSLWMGTLFCLIWISVSQAHAAVRINEINYNPPGTDANHEWIEVVNDGNETVNLANWKLNESGSDHVFALVQGTLSLPGNGYAVLTGSGATFIDDHSGFAGTVIHTSFSLSNTGESIAIMDAIGTTVDTVAYASAFGNGNGFTLERNASGQWVESVIALGTPGEENSILTPPSALLSTSTNPGDILINEFEAAPATGGSEWIELFNASVHAIDLSFLTIEDTTGTPHMLSGSFNPGEYLILEPSPVSLNNVGDMIVLRRASDAVIVDLVTYGSSAPATASGSSILPTASGSILPATGSGSTTPATTAVPTTGKSIGAYLDSALTGSGRTLRVLPQPTKGSVNIVNNHPPVAVITIQSPVHTSGPAPLSLNVTAESSTDPDGDSLSYLWEYGDGTRSTSANPTTKRYESAGTFTLKLTVTDDFGASSVATESITVTAASSGGGGGGGAGTGSSSSNTSAPSCATRTLAADLILNEVFPNPAGGDAKGEFVEIYNAQTSDVNLCGWSIDDAEGGSKAYVISTNTMIKAGSYRAFFATETNLAFNNDKDAARLTNPEGKEISLMGYSQGEKGKSYSRFARASKETWRWSVPTPNQANADTEKQALRSSSLRINELLPNPTGTDGSQEFIELYNDTQRMNLRGFSVHAAKETFTFAEDTWIEAQSFLVLHKNQTNITLTNVSETVELKDAEGNLIDITSYEAAPSGQSWSLVLPLGKNEAEEDSNSQNTSDTWTWGDPTPGEENRILGKTILSSDQQTFSATLRQGRKVLYIEGVTMPDADVTLALFHVADDDSIPPEPDLELKARSGTRSGKYSVAIPIVLSPGVYRIVATIKPNGGAEFTNNASRIEIVPDAQQANETKLITTPTKKSSSSLKTSTTSRKTSAAVPAANAEEDQTDFGPFIGGGAEGLSTPSSRKAYLYTALVLFVLSGIGTIAFGKLRAPGA